MPTINTYTDSSMSFYWKIIKELNKSVVKHLHKFARSGFLILNMHFSQNVRGNIFSYC